MPPIREQIADSISGGQLTEARAALQKFGEQYTTLYSETRKLTREVETLKEGGTIKEGYTDQSWNDRLQIDRHWQVMSGYQQHRIIQKSDVDLYRDLMGFAYQFSPLIKAAIDIKTRYTFGLSFSIVPTDKADETNKTAILDIVGDLRNRNALFGAQAITEADRELQKGGNIYIAIWWQKNPVQVRVWTSYEIQDVIMDPQDGDTPLYYKRQWLTQAGDQRTAYYPSIFNTQDFRRNEYAADEFGNPVTPDFSIVVYQMSEGRGLKQKWALSPLTSALRWNRAYEQFLLDFAVIVQMIRKYSTMFTTKGGEAQVTALQSQFAHEQHGHHASQVGDGLIATEGNQFQVIDAGSGKIVGPQDSRYFLIPVCASTGVPENLLTGNPQTGNRASAQELTANFLPIIEERQTMWTETFKMVFQWILENEDFAVSFPPIRSQDALTYLQGLSTVTKYLQPEDIIRAVYEALDLKIPDDTTIDDMVAGIQAQINAQPDTANALTNLTQATNMMNAAIKEMMEKQKAATA